MLRRRAAPASTEDGKAEAAPATGDAGGAQPAAPPRAWHEHLSVRAILFLLALFLLMHLALWAVVYSFWRDQDHTRLRSTVHEAWSSLSALREHL
jgi:hypothetical protein